MVAAPEKFIGLKTGPICSERMLAKRGRESEFAERRIEALKTTLLI
jgi:hypothetical protein